MSLLRITMLSVLLAMLSACATTPKELEQLDLSLLSYERYIRWGEFDQARAMHKDEPVLDDLERRRLKLYRITSYNTVHRQNNSTENAFVLVEIRYYNQTRAIEKTLSHKQEWEYNKEKERWYIRSAFPDFR